MTDSSSNDGIDRATGKRPQSVPDKLSGEPIYTYASAGIGERKGHVPIWLWIVVISLSIWGIYYVVTYWNPPLAH